MSALRTAVEEARKQEDLVVAALKALIKEKGKTLREVGEALGMRQDYLSQVLRGSKGTVDLKAWHLFAILRVLGITPSEFFARRASQEEDKKVATLDTYRELSRRDLAQIKAELQDFVEEELKKRLKD